MKKALLLISCLALAVLVAVPAFAGTAKSTTPDYDAVKDFSLASNPNGVWSYGWMPTQGVPMTLYTWSDFETCAPGMSYWANYLGILCTAYPALGHNDTDKIICGSTWCNPVNWLSTHPGPEDEFSVIRFTAPSSGTYLLEGAVVGEDTGGTDFHIVLNTTQYLLNIPNTGYKTQVHVQHSLTLTAGDTVDIVVGWGANHNFYGDSTGIQFKMTMTGAAK